MYAGVRGTSEWGLRRWVGFRVMGWGLWYKRWSSGDHAIDCWQ